MSRYKVVVNGDRFIDPVEAEFSAEAQAVAAKALAERIMRACPPPRQINSVRLFADAGWVEVP